MWWNWPMYPSPYDTILEFGEIKRLKNIRSINWICYFLPKSSGPVNSNTTHWTILLQVQWVGPSWWSHQAHCICCSPSNQERLRLLSIVSLLAGATPPASLFHRLNGATVPLSVPHRCWSPLPPPVSSTLLCSVIRDIVHSPLWKPQNCSLRCCAPQNGVFFGQK